MNRDDIIRMAGEAGFMQHLGVIAIPNIQNLERFATLVAAAERERCARLVETFYTSNPNLLAEAIRAEK